MRHVARAVLSGVVGLLLALPLTVVAGTAATTRSVHPQPPRMSHAQAKAVLDRARRLRHIPPGARVGRHGRPDPTLVLRDLVEARPSLSAAERTEADRILARPTDPNDGGLLRYPSSARLASLGTTHFVVHYDSNTRDSGYTTPAQVDDTAQVLEHVYAVEVGRLGYRKPLPDTPKTPSAGNPDGRVDVFLGDIGTLGYYGYCASDHPSSTAHLQPSYCVLDNDYAEFEGTRQVSLEVTVAHEFFHVLQAAYDYTEDVWLLEGSAVWMEDQVYDAANDYRQFVPDTAIRHPGTPLDYDDGAFSVYGAFAWFTYLSESLHDPDIVRQIWRRAAASSNTDGGLYSLPATKAALATQGISFVPAFATYAEWNTLPTGSYSERAGWPGPAVWRSITLSRTSTDSGTFSTTLRHLSSATARFAPAADVPAGARLRLTIDLPDTSHGSAAIVQVRHDDGTPDRVVRVALDSHGNASVLADFDPAHDRAVVVTLTNAGTAMRACGSGSAYACGGYGVDDGGRFGIRGRLV